MAKPKKTPRPEGEDPPGALAPAGTPQPESQEEWVNLSEAPAGAPAVPGLGPQEAPSDTADEERAGADPAPEDGGMQPGASAVLCTGGPTLEEYDTLSAEIAHLAADAFQAKDFLAHAELHQVEMAIAHLRQVISTACRRLAGEPQELLEQLLEGL